MYKIKTEIGAIRISKAVIGRVIKDAMSDFHKSVYLVNRKGAGMGQFGEEYRSNAGNLLEIKIDGGKVDVSIHIILKFGQSIKKTTEDISKAVRLSVESSLGIVIDSLTIHIVGVKSKDVAKRNIVVKC